MTVTFSTSGSSLSSIRPTDLTARLTKTAIDTIAMAITINDDAMTTMIQNIAQLSTPDGGHLAALADWTDRIKAGELPSATPARPTGVERNVVVTVRDWSDPKHYLHDLIATDRRDPTVNGYGLMYGAAELSTDKLPVLDPVKNTKSVLDVPLGVDTFRALDHSHPQPIVTAIAPCFLLRP